RAVPGLASVDGDEEDPAVGGLSDSRARMAWRQLIRGEVLERPIDGLAVTHDDRPASKRLQYVRPRRRQRQEDGEIRTGGRFGREEGGLRAACDDDGPVRRDRLIAARDVLGDG